MANGKKGKGKSSVKLESLQNINEQSLRGAEDNPEDPLFVPRLDMLALHTEAVSAGVDEYSALLESICGAIDDSQAVEQYDGSLGVAQSFVANHQSAVCQLQWNSNLSALYTNPGNVSGVRWGTGTMISDDIMITCGHLFDQTGGGWMRPRVNGTSNIISPQEIARNMKANFNFQVDSAGNPQPEQSFAISELVEYRLGNVDMAICRVAGNPGAIFGHAAVSTTDASPPEMICIIGHPVGQPKRVEAGPTIQIDADRIRYNDIDTQGGNSGSGILRASDGKLVGVHTNGGCTPQSPAPSAGSNFGLRIEKFIQVSPVLQCIVAPVKSKFRDDIINKPKVQDDQIHKLKFIDDGPVKLKFRDDKFKAFDDVKNAFKDKGFDRNPRLPGLPGGPRPVRPFSLNTPHHAFPRRAEEEASQELYEWEEYLRSLHAFIEERSSELAELQSHFEESAAEYERHTGSR